MRTALAGLVVAGAMLVPVISIAGPQTQADIRLIAVVGTSNNDRRFEAFGLGADGHIYHRWQQAAGQPWSDWAENVAGNFTDVKVLRASGRLYVFGLDSGVLVFRAQASPGSGFSENSLRTGSVLRGLAVATDTAQRIFVVAIGGSGELWTLHSLSDSPEARAEDWSGWDLIGGSQLDT